MGRGSYWHGPSRLGLLYCFIVWSAVLTRGSCSMECMARLGFAIITTRITVTSAFCLVLRVPTVRIKCETSGASRFRQHCEGAVTQHLLISSIANRVRAALSHPITEFLRIERGQLQAYLHNTHGRLRSRPSTTCSGVRPATSMHSTTLILSARLLTRRAQGRERNWLMGAYIGPYRVNERRKCSADGYYIFDTVVCLA
jgi:hypothetical protein